MEGSNLRSRRATAFPQMAGVCSRIFLTVSNRVALESLIIQQTLWKGFAPIEDVCNPNGPEKSGNNTDDGGEEYE